MTVTEDRATALLDRPLVDRTGGRAGTAAPQDREPPAAPAAWSDPDLRSMRWAVLVSFLLGAYAAACVVFGVSLTP